MSCGGKVFDAGDPLPADLQGTWLGTADKGGETVRFVIAGNQASVLFIEGTDYTTGTGDNLKEIKGATPFRIDIGFNAPASFDNPTADLGGSEDEGYFTIDFYDFMTTKDNLRGTVKGYFDGATNKIKIFSSEGEGYFYGLPPVGAYDLK